MVPVLRYGGHLLIMPSGLSMNVHRVGDTPGGVCGDRAAAASREAIIHVLICRRPYAPKYRRA
ncbi:hypothetical protein GCM10027290_31220 [Micromonospora sonneratiae]